MWCKIQCKLKQVSDLQLFAKVHCSSSHKAKVYKLVNKMCIFNSTARSQKWGKKTHSKAKEKPYFYKQSRRQFKSLMGWAALTLHTKRYSVLKLLSFLWEYSAKPGYLSRGKNRLWFRREIQFRELMLGNHRDFV